MSELPANPKKLKLKQDEEANEQEEVLVALVEHRSNEVERLNQHISNYQTKLIEAERSLQNSKAKLDQLRGVSSVPSDSAKKDNKPLKTLRNVSEDYASPSPSKTLRSCDSSDHPRSSSSCVSKAKTVLVKQKTEPSRDSPNVKDRGTKRKFEQKEHKELIRLIARNSSPTTIKCHTSNQISSQHKRKLRSLILCPVNEQLFATSSLDGMVSLWQLQPGRLAASLLSITDCMSRKQRRWAEDMAWHPSGNTLFSVYTADDG